MSQDSSPPPTALERLFANADAAARALSELSVDDPCYERRKETRDAADRAAEAGLKKALEENDPELARLRDELHALSDAVAELERQRAELSKRLAAIANAVDKGVELVAAAADLPI